jgi:hypothetical protein
MLIELMTRLTPLKDASFVAALIAFGTGLYAALKWLQASKIDVDLGYCLPGDPTPGTYRRMGVVLTRKPEPVDPALSQMNETVATWEAMGQAAVLNKVAARWTAASVAFSALSAVMGAIAWWRRRSPLRMVATILCDRLLAAGFLRTIRPLMRSMRIARTILSLTGSPHIRPPR